MRVIIGMSGGVDSTIAAYLLKKQGHEVIGVTMCIDSRSLDIQKEIDGAKKVCDLLGIKHDVINVEKDFREKIIDRFVQDYVHGFTPPPCSICNGKIKFKMLIEYKDKVKADKIATGHYAGVENENDRCYIRRSHNEKKDQSYMLYNLSQDEMKDLLFPIGDMDKEDIRDIAKDLKLDVSDKKDSEDLCFIKDIDYKEFIKRYFLGQDYQYKIANGELTENEVLGKCSFLKKGKFVDKNGKVLGYHNGIINYTIGQRKGLNIALGDRQFVLDINVDKNEIILGDDEDLYRDDIFIDANKDIMWQKMEPLNIGEKLNCKVKVRYRDSFHPCIVMYDGEKIHIKSEEKIRAITKGQVAVCYEDDKTLFGGIIV